VTISVLLADDHDVVREGEQRILEAAGMKVIGHAVDVNSAWELYHSLSPDVLVMDMSMPGSAGVDGVVHIIQRDPNAKIVIFSIHENPLLVERVLAAGALGYVTKGSDLSELVVAVNTVYQGQSYVSSDLAQTLIHTRISGNKDPISILSAREFNVFCLVAEGFNTPDIAKTLFLAEKTVANYVSQIKQKLEITNTVEIVHLAIKNKIIQIE